MASFGTQQTYHLQNMWKTGEFGVGQIQKKRYGNQQSTQTWDSDYEWRQSYVAP